MKLLILLILLSSQVVFARPGLSPEALVPIEGWVKIDCVGPISPAGYDAQWQPYPLVMKKVMSFFLQADVNAPFPSVSDLRNQHMDFFTKINVVCTEKRMAMVNWAGFNGVPYDWGSDYSYTKFEIGEEFIYNNMCRAEGKPCRTTAQCCGGPRAVTCDKVTNSCASTIKKADAVISSQR